MGWIERTVGAKRARWALDGRDAVDPVTCGGGVPRDLAIGSVDEATIGCGLAFCRLAVFC